MSDQQAPSLTEAAVRKVAAEALELLALALAVAAGVVFVLMIVVLLRSENEGGPGDFPGRYWFAVLPLGAAALTLALGADRVERPRRSSAPATPDDWYR